MQRVDAEEVGSDLARELDQLSERREVPEFEASPDARSLLESEGCRREIEALRQSDRLDLCNAGVNSTVLGKDDFFYLPPKLNGTKRRESANWLSP